MLLVTARHLRLQRWWSERRLLWEAWRRRSSRWRWNAQSTICLLLHGRLWPLIPSLLRLLEARRLCLLELGHLLLLLLRSPRRMRRQTSNLVEDGLISTLRFWRLSWRLCSLLWLLWRRWRRSRSLRRLQRRRQKVQASNISIYLWPRRLCRS